MNSTRGGQEDFRLGFFYSGLSPIEGGTCFRLWKREGEGLQAERERRLFPNPARK